MKTLTFVTITLCMLSAALVYADGPIRQPGTKPESWQRILRITEPSPGEGPGRPALKIVRVTSAWYGTTDWTNPTDWSPKDLVQYWGMECTVYPAIYEDDGNYWQSVVYPPVHWQMYFFEDIGGDFVSTVFGAQYLEWWPLELWTWNNAEGYWEFLYNTWGNTDPFYVDVTNRLNDDNLIVICFDPYQEVMQSITIDFAHVYAEYQ